MLFNLLVKHPCYSILQAGVNSMNYSNQLRANCGHVRIYGRYAINLVADIEGKLMNIDQIKDSPPLIVSSKPGEREFLRK
jgi:hypothetical protein